MNIDSVLAYGNKTNGRDKLLRMTQYLTKLSRWYLLQNNKFSDLQAKLKIVESQISTGRKLFRLGRTLDSWRSAQKSMNIVDPFLQVTVTTTHINKAFFLLVDHYLWFAKVGLIKTNVKHWDDVSSRFYLTSLILSVIRDLYAVEIKLNQKMSSTDIDESYQSSNINFANFLSKVFSVLIENPKISIDLFKNICDLYIPISRLGYVQSNDGVMGCLGTISSVLAAIQITSPNFKLKP